MYNNLNEPGSGSGGGSTSNSNLNSPNTLPLGYDTGNGNIVFNINNTLYSPPSIQAQTNNSNNNNNTKAISFKTLSISSDDSSVSTSSNTSSGSNSKKDKKEKQSDKKSAKKNKQSLSLLIGNTSSTNVFVSPTSAGTPTTFPFASSHTIQFGSSSSMNNNILNSSSSSSINSSNISPSSSNIPPSLSFVNNNNNNNNNNNYRSSGFFTTYSVGSSSSSSSSMSNNRTLSSKKSTLSLLSSSSSTSNLSILSSSSASLASTLAPNLLNPSPVKMNNQNPIDPTLIERNKVCLDDLSELREFDEDTLISNIQTRFKKNIIYTNIGPILVSVNPFQKLPNVFSQELLRLYIQRDGERLLPPHIFAMTEKAYMDMVDFHKNQVILISGESGSGKSENAKVIVQYLLACNTTSDNEFSHIKNLILESNSILEAFGHCSTGHNPNSSRWGKYFEIYYNFYGDIQGSKIYNYFLDESKVTFQLRGERNFHIFYQLLVGLGEEDRKTYGISNDPNQYHYLNQGGVSSVDEINDAGAFERLKMAFNFFEFTETQIDLIYRTLSFILHLGNINFIQPNKSAKIEIKDRGLLDFMAKLISFDTAKLEMILLDQLPPEKNQTSNITSLNNNNSFNNIKDKAEKSPPTIAELVENRDALGKSIYSTLFHWIVDSLNSRLIPKSYMNSIGLLDLFGQENNQLSGSYEQFSINYLEEQLQQIYLQTILKLEQDDYKKEQITWVKPIGFKDNFDSLELVEKIVSLLDQESKNQNSNDTIFLEKLTNFVGGHKLFTSKPKKSFSVDHFFGNTVYDIKGFIQKNRDEIYYKSLQLYKFSILSGIINEEKDKVEKPVVENSILINNSNNINTTIVLNSSNVILRSNNFSRKNPLSILKVLPSGSNYHFVRCLKPNSKRAPLQFDQKFVMEQIKTMCLMETTKIQRYGYTVSYPTKIFFDRFSLQAQRIISGIVDNLAKDHVQIESMQQPFQMGQTKIFLRYSVGCLLDLARQKRRHQAAVTIQKNWKMYKERSNFLRVKKATLVLQKSLSNWLIRRRYISLKTAVHILESNAQMIIDRSNYLKLKESTVILQTYLRALLVKNYINDIKSNNNSFDNLTVPTSLQITPYNTPPTSPNLFVYHYQQQQQLNSNGTTQNYIGGTIQSSRKQNYKIPSVKIGSRNSVYNSKDSGSPLSPLSPTPQNNDNPLSPPIITTAAAGSTDQTATPYQVSPPISPKKFEMPLESPRKNLLPKSTTITNLASKNSYTTKSTPPTAPVPTPTPNNFDKLTLDLNALTNPMGKEKDNRSRTQSLNRRKSSPQLVTEPVSPKKQQDLPSPIPQQQSQTSLTNSLVSPRSISTTSNNGSLLPQQSPRSANKPHYFPSTSPSLVNKALNSNSVQSSSSSSSSSHSKPFASALQDPLANSTTIATSSSSSGGGMTLSKLNSYSPLSFSLFFSTQYPSPDGCPPVLPIYKASYLVNTHNHLNNSISFRGTSPSSTANDELASPILSQLQQHRRRSKSILGKPIDHDEFNFIDYAKQYFESKQKKSIISRKKEPSFDHLITFSKKLSNSLHPLSPDLEKIALEIFTCILQYMGDSERKKSHSDAALCSFIIGQGLVHLELRDEVYCQLMKQISNHPGKRENKIRGWEILAMASGAFTPNPSLIKYVTSFLMKFVRTNNENLHTPNYISEDDGFANYCMNRLDAIISRGGCRSLPPVESEFEAVRKKVSLLLTFFFPDDVGEDIEIDSTTTAGAITEQLTGLSKLKSESFVWAIFEVWKNKERSLTKSEFILDIVSKWENYYHSVSHYNHSSHGGEPITLDQPFQFYFKIQLFLKPQKPPAKHELPFLFHQLLRSVSKRHLPMTEMELIKLSALRNHYDTHFCSVNLKTPTDIWLRYIPEKLVNVINSTSFLEQIQLKYKEYSQYLSVLKKDDLCNVITSYLMFLPFYGTTIFYDCSLHHFSDIEPAYEFHLVIDINGIHIIAKDDPIINPSNTDQKSPSPRSSNESEPEKTSFFNDPEFDKFVSLMGLSENETTLLKALSRPEKKFKTIQSFSFSKLTGFKVALDVSDGTTAGLTFDDEDLLIQSEQTPEIIQLINTIYTHLTLESTTAMAIKDYIQPSDQFSFKKGDFITNITRSLGDEAWGRGTVGDATGTFPLDFIRFNIPEPVVIDNTKDILKENKDIKEASSNATASITKKESTTNQPVTTTPSSSSIRTSSTKSTVSSKSKPPVIKSSSSKNVQKSTNNNNTSNSSLVSSTTAPVSLTSKTVDFGSKHPLMKYAANRFKSISAFKLVESLRYTNKIADYQTFFVDLPSEIQKELDSIFIDIMKYMGDYPLPPKEHTTRLLQSIIQRAINKVKLRDEIYFFLCRQLTSNPSNEGIRKGIVLFSLCAGCFPASAELVPYLKDFLSQIGNETCIKKLQMTALKGPRLYAPSKQEIRLTKTNKNIKVKIYLANDPKGVEIQINASTTADEALKAIVKELELTNYREYAIYKQYQSKEQCVKDHEKITDILTFFEDVKKRSKTREKQYSRQQKQQAHQQQQFLHDDDFDTQSMCSTQSMSSTLTLSLHSNNSLSSSGSIIFSDNNVSIYDPLVDIPRGEIDGKLILLRRIWIPHTSLSMSNGMLELMFFQYIHETVMSKIPGLDIKMAIELAALQIQAKKSDPSYVPFDQNNPLIRYVPTSLYPLMSPTQWTADIMKAHADLENQAINPDRALTMYIGRCSSFPYAGTTWFSVYQKVKEISVWIGVNQHAIIIFNSEMKGDPIGSWSLDEISGFTYRDDSFSFLVGDLQNPKRWLFYTHQGDEINEIYEIYKSLPKIDLNELQKLKERKRERKEKEKRKAELKIQQQP